MSSGQPSFGAPAAGPSAQPAQPPWVRRLLSTKEEDNRYAYEVRPVYVIGGSAC
ncbi:MAG: hypothetical protein INR71_13135 [Terriglobus roseus]|nr:hypothetical protein [Terriglobus roseus]